MRDQRTEERVGGLPIETRLLLWRRIWAKLLAPPEGPEPGADATGAGDGTAADGDDQEAA